MIRILTFLILALQCFTATACKSEESAPSNSLRFEIQRNSITDFYSFLEAIKLLVSQRESSLDVAIGPKDKKLSFISVAGFPGDPLLIHVSTDQVAIGSGSTHQPLTVDQLHAHLEVFADAASKAGSKGIVLLVSDRQVSGEFGLAILNAILESGIPTVMLAKPDLPEVQVRVPSKKPSPPFSR